MASKKPKFFQKLKGSLRSHAERSQSPAQPSRERNDALAVVTEVPSAAYSNDTPDSNIPRNYGTLETDIPEERDTDTNASAAEVENLWDKASQCLTKENPSLVKEYERILDLEEAETAGRMYLI